MSNQIREEVVKNYDDSEECKTKLNGQCTIKLEIKERIVAPVYVYYQLDNFYQNHRRYVKSRSFKQLQGFYLPVSQLAECDPIKTNKDLRPQIIKYADGTLFTAEDDALPAIPCGLVAKSLFNDTYVFRKKDVTPDIKINSNGIAWESDIKYKFGNVQNTTVGTEDRPWWKTQWTNMTNGNNIISVNV